MRNLGHFSWVGLQKLQQQHYQLLSQCLGFLMCAQRLISVHTLCPRGLNQRHKTVSSKHARWDQIRKHFSYGQLWPLRPAGSQNRAGSYIPDPTSRIWFSSVLPKAWIIKLLCKTDPDLIWMAWSGFGQRHLVWKQAGVPESSGPVSGRMQPARYQFPTFRLSCILPQMPQIILCKTSLGLIYFTSGWLYQVWAKRIQSGSKPVFKNHPAHFWPMLLSQSGSDGNQIRHIYWECAMVDWQEQSLAALGNWVCISTAQRFWAWCSTN